MISTKWFDVTVGSKPREFLHLLRQKSYGRSSQMGFDLSYSQEKAISGRFIEEIHATSTYTSPLGEEITNHLVTHKIVAFSFHYLRESRWLLRVDGNPRSLRSFSRCLSDILNFDFSIAQVITPVLDVLGHMEASGVRVVKVASLYAANLPFGKGGLGKIEIRATSNGDALVAFSKLFPKMDPSIERMSAQIEFESQITSLTLSKNGGVAFNDESEDSIAPIYMNFLSTMLKTK